MKSLRAFFQFVFSLFLVGLTACAPTATPSTPTAPTALSNHETVELVQTPTSLPAPSTATPRHAPTPTVLPYSLSDFPGAESVSVATTTESTYLVFGREASLFVTRSGDGGQTFDEPARATLDAHVHILPIERPAIAVNDPGEVGVAWLEMAHDFTSATVWYARSADSGRTFAPGQLVSTERNGETTMVQVALDAAGNPVLAWLRGNDLRFARSSDGGASFPTPESIGDGSCECCQPQIVINGDQIFIAYRSLALDTKGFIRDAAVVHSNDGGRTFEPVAPVSDAHWYLNACPISGPSLALGDGRVYVTWMDGRDAPPEISFEGDIWFAASVDGGRTFSPNLQVNSELSLHHTLPVIAVGPGGRIHLAWEAEAMDAIYYATSDDGGQTFSPPTVMAGSSDPERGRPGKPSLAVNEQGQVYLAWLDDLGARLATWTDPN